MMNARTLLLLAAAAAVSTTHARPMNADMVPHYARYLEARSDVEVELDAWMKKFEGVAGKNGWIPASEARSADEQKEERLQRFFLTKEKIKEVEKLNPDATFSTDSPFSLLTDEEFNKYVGNAYRKAEDVARKLRGANGSPAATVSGDSDSDSTGSDREATTWSNTLPANWLDWWNSVTVNHSNNNNYSPGAVEPFDPDAPASDSDSTGDNYQPDDDTTSNEDNALTQAPATDDNNNNNNGDSGYDFNSATAAPTAADADTSHQGAGSVDWSTSNCVAPIQNQGQCGSCWAFASTAAVESAQCIAGGQQTLTKYSEQQLTSCDRRNGGCNGGAPVYAFEYIQQNGLCTEDAFPYTSSNGYGAACSTNCQKHDTGIKGYAKVNDEAELLATLGQHPVVVAVASGNNAWKQYSGGVLSSCDSWQVDHAVLAVGYDDSTIKIKNSWGTSWGEGGYIRLKRGTPGQGTCGVFTDMSHPLM